MGNEIIIDGVNVAGCLFLTECGTYHFCCGNDIRESDLPFANYCKENANCYYKQLKRLEQERNEKVMAKARMYDYQRAIEKIKEIINIKLDTRLVRLNGQAPMIFNADFCNKIKQPILDLISEVLK